MEQVRIVKEMNFNPRPPARGATLRRQSGRRWVFISIHAPRKGGDPAYVMETATRKHFNPRPPRGGRRRRRSGSMQS